MTKKDQGANLFADTLPSSYLSDSGDPRPIQTKSRSMPIHNGSRSDQARTNGSHKPPQVEENSDGLGLVISKIVKIFSGKYKP
jgi:hypothetical protein